MQQSHQTGAHSYREVSHRNYVQRVGDSFGGAVFGVAVLILSLVLIWWNEQNAVATAKELMWLRHETTPIGLPVHGDVANLAGRPVHITGPVEGGSVSDRMSSYTLTVNAAVLERKVEMYQWVERTRTTTKKELGGGETTTKDYTYDTEWSTRHHSSKNYKIAGHENPSMLPDQRYTPPRVAIGPVRLGKEVIDKLPTTTMMVQRDMFGRADEYGAIQYDGSVYMGYNAQSPSVGDLRITYKTFAHGERATVIGVIHGDSTVTGAPNSVLPLVGRGEQSVEELISGAESRQAILCWVLRVVGVLGTYMAILMCTSPIKTLVSIIPFAEGIVGFLTGWLALIPAISLSVTVMAIAWIYARPIMSFGLLIFSILIFIFGKTEPDRPKQA